MLTVVKYRVPPGYRSSPRLCTCLSTSHDTLVRLLDLAPCLRLETYTDAWEIDLFWSFTDSAYNTIFKILFISSSAYTIYLMINDYKPTQDPNIDTFKVQYLLGASALLGVLFPYKYIPSEVCSPRYCLVVRVADVWKDALGFFHLA